MTTRAITYLTELPYAFYTWGLALAFLLASVAARTDTLLSGSVYVFYFASAVLWSVMHTASSIFKSKAFAIGGVLFTLFWVAFLTFFPDLSPEYKTGIFYAFSFFDFSLALFLILYLRWKKPIPVEQNRAPKTQGPLQRKPPTLAPDLILGGIVALLALLIGFLHGFTSPAFGEWLTLGGAYWGFILPVIVALKNNWTPRTALITAGAGLVWMLAFPTLTHGHAEVVDGPLTLFSLSVTAVILIARKITRPKAPEGPPQAEPPGA